MDLNIAVLIVINKQSQEKLWENTFLIITKTWYWSDKKHHNTVKWQPFEIVFELSLIFDHSGTLLVHHESLVTEIMETSEKIYKCSVCQRIGKRKDNMLIHVKTHLPCEPETCDFCGKVFKTKNSLTSHVSRWHRQEK